MSIIIHSSLYHCVCVFYYVFALSFSLNFILFYVRLSHLIIKIDRRWFNIRSQLFSSLDIVMGSRRWVGGRKRRKAGTPNFWIKVTPLRTIGQKYKPLPAPSNSRWDRRWVGEGMGLGMVNGNEVCINISKYIDYRLHLNLHILQREKLYNRTCKFSYVKCVSHNLKYKCQWTLIWCRYRGCFY